jgi:hypothetical protein
MARGERLGMVSPVEARTYLAYQRSGVAGVMEYVPAGAVAASATGAPRGSLALFCAL